MALGWNEAKDRTLCALLAQISTQSQAVYFTTSETE